MFFNSKPTNRLAPSAKSRLNSHAHKLDNAEPMRTSRRSPERNPGPPSPSEVLVFNTTAHGSGAATRAGHYNKSLPEVPNYEDIQKFMKQSWDERIARINDPNSKLKVLWIKSFAEEEKEREEALKKENNHASSSSSSQPSTPKQKNSPQHHKK